MQLPPPHVMSSWPKANYVDPVTRGNAQIVINLVLYPIVILTILLRVYTRVFHLRRNTFSIDDTLILLAMIPTTAFFVLSILADTHFLWRRHVYDIPTTELEMGIKVLLTVEILFTLACTLCKLSILFLLRRVLATATLFWRRITLGAIWLVALQGIAFFFAMIFQCQSPSEYWTITAHPQPECINPTSMFLVFGIVNTFTDFLVVVLPIRTVLSLDLPRSQTRIVIILFGLGLLGSGAGVARTIYMYEVDLAYDSTWLSFPVWITAALELYLGLICASIPATKPLFSTYIPKLFTATTSYASRAKTPISSPIIQNRFSALNITPKDDHSNTSTFTSTNSYSPSTPTTPSRAYFSGPMHTKRPSGSSYTTRGTSMTQIGSRGLPTPYPTIIPSHPNAWSRNSHERGGSHSSIRGAETDARRRDMEADYNARYGNHGAYGQYRLPQLTENTDSYYYNPENGYGAYEGDEVDLEDFVIMNNNANISNSNRYSGHGASQGQRQNQRRSHRRTQSEDMVVQDGRTMLPNRSSRYSWDGGEDFCVRGGEMEGRRGRSESVIRVDRVFSVGFEDGFGGSGIKDFDLERGFP